MCADEDSMCIFMTLTLIRLQSCEAEVSGIICISSWNAVGNVIDDILELKELGQRQQNDIISSVGGCVKGDRILYVLKTRRISYNLDPVEFPDCC